MGNKILILFAHPRLEKSRANATLIKQIPRHPDITIHDLYENYPDFNINPLHEKKLLSNHQIIIWHHPFYWYSAPPLLKQWIDIVLEYGWAYGPLGDALKGKFIFNVITSGGQRQVYQREGYNRFTVKELLAPFDQTATLCKMMYLPPFAIHGTHKLTADELSVEAANYTILLDHLLKNDFSVEEMREHDYLNDWLKEKIKRYE